MESGTPKAGVRADPKMLRKELTDWLVRMKSGTVGRTRRGELAALSAVLAAAITAGGVNVGLSDVKELTEEFGVWLVAGLVLEPPAEPPVFPPTLEAAGLVDPLADAPTVCPLPTTFVGLPTEEVGVPLVETGAPLVEAAGAVLTGLLTEVTLGLPEPLTVPPGVAPTVLPAGWVEVPAVDTTCDPLPRVLGVLPTCVFVGLLTGTFPPALTVALGDPAVGVLPDPTAEPVDCVA